MSNAGTPTSLPKIKLKLPPAATPTADSTEGTSRSDGNGVLKLNNADIRKSYKKKASTAPSQGTSAKKKKTAASVGASPAPSPALTSEADPVGTTTSYGTTVINGGSKTSKRRLPANIADSDGLFGDYVSALKAAITYQRSKSWTLKKAQLRTATGYTLDLAEWCTKHTPKPIVATSTTTQAPPRPHSLRITMEEPDKGGGKSARPVALPASQAIKLAKQGSGTFVCTHEGCHRIFDDQTRWRRHQNGHIRHVK